MADPRLEDHAVGVELQLTELTEELQRAKVQHREDRVAELEGEIAELQDDLAATAERIVTETWHEAQIRAPHPL
jgi:hypothetical protein